MLVLNLQYDECGTLRLLHDKVSRTQMSVRPVLVGGENVVSDNHIVGRLRAVRRLLTDVPPLLQTIVKHTLTTTTQPISGHKTNMS